MIISASRRTDIPAFYTEWLRERLRAGSVTVQNPFNARQQKEVALSSSSVEGIVFWSKNPRPLLSLLDNELDGIPVAIQYTLNAYGAEIEPDIPAWTDRIDTFRTLAEKISPRRMVWRYDPIFLNDRYPLSFHVDAFGRTARALRGFTEKAVISFLDIYPRIARRAGELELHEPADMEKLETARQLVMIAQAYGLQMETCAEAIELSGLGIPHGACIDGALFAPSVGGLKKDRSQRPFCGCRTSVDIGRYGTCRHGCVYCYAGGSRPASPTAGLS